MLPQKCMLCNIQHAVLVSALVDNLFLCKVLGQWFCLAGQSNQPPYVHSASDSEPTRKVTSVASFLAQKPRFYESWKYYQIRKIQDPKYLGLNGIFLSDAKHSLLVQCFLLGRPSQPTAARPLRIVCIVVELAWQRTRKATTTSPGPLTTPRSNQPLAAPAIQHGGHTVTRTYPT